MTIKLIISDIDGCLTPEESIPWELDDFMELAKLTRSAHEPGSPLPPMTLCTGRPQPYVEALMKIFDVRHPGICENGAVLYTLHNNRAYYGPGVTPEKIDGLRAVRAFIEHEILPDHPEATFQFGKEAQLSVFSENVSVFAEMQQRVEEFIKQNNGPTLDIHPSQLYLNLSLTGVSKGAAIESMLAELGIDKSETVGIGDSEGDNALADEVGWFAAPANAVKSLKDRADYVAQHDALPGILEILENLPQ